MSQVGENSLEAMVEVLLLTIYADDVVRSEERISLIDELPTLSIFVESIEGATEQEVRNLVWEYEPKVRESISSQGRDNYERDSFYRISDHTLQRVLYAAMRYLSNVDNELHPTESALIDRAGTIWGL